MKRTKIIIPLLIAALLAGCGSRGAGESASSNDGFAPDYQDSKEETIIDKGETAPMEPQEDSNATVTNISEKKIIDRASLSIETLEFDKALDTLQKTLEEYKGYMESSNINHPGVGSNNYKTYRNADFVVRIPKENFQNFLKAAENIGIITNENTSSEDITKQYYDTETRIKVYEAQEARYLELLKEAKTMEDILTIERQLTEVRYNIEYLAGYKNQMKDLVDYGTVTIALYEVDEPSKVIDVPKNLGDKIVNAFKASLDSLKYVGTGFILMVVALIPYGIIFGLLGGVAFYVYRKIKKSKK